MSQLVFGLIAFGLCIIIACRIDKMLKGVTMPSIFWQHAILGICAFAGLVAGFTEYQEWSGAILALGVFQFFLFSLKRWRKHAPGDTIRPLEEIPHEQLRHVVGGTKR
jgi:hypothetical protein